MLYITTKDLKTSAEHTHAPAHTKFLSDLTFNSLWYYFTLEKNPDTHFIRDSFVNTP